METRTGRISFDAVERKEEWTIHGLGFTGLASFVLWRLTTVEYGDPPLIAMLVVALIVCGFLFFLVTGLSMLALCAGKIVVDREEITLRLGSLVLKRIPTGEIRTVAFAHASFGRHRRTVDVPMLVLSTEDAQRLMERGERVIRRGGDWNGRFRSMGFASDSRKVCVYAALCEAVVSYLLPGKKGLLIGYSRYRTELLRRYFAGAEFLM